MKYTKFEDDLHSKLRDPEYALAYVESALEDDGIDEFLVALREVAIATGGVKVVANKSHHGRESLYKSLSREGNPRIKTLDDVLKVMGMRIAVVRTASETTSQSENPMSLTQ